MSALAVHGVEELTPYEAQHTTGGSPVLAAGVAIAGLMLAAASTGFKFGYEKVGPWLMENVF